MNISEAPKDGGRCPDVNATFGYVVVGGGIAGLTILPPGHPQATIYTLAEKIADQVLRELHNSVASFKVQNDQIAFIRSTRLLNFPTTKVIDIT